MCIEIKSSNKLSNPRESDVIYILQKSFVNFKCLTL